jgi:5-bromo-4-chloroindolyl phosphate hydrolysis protein
MIRHDDNFEDLIVAWCAMVFYVLGGMFTFIAIISQIWVVIIVGVFGLGFGGFFHFMKVSTDGRVRWKDLERKHQEYLKKRREALEMDKDS